jgi:polyhydroxyalkanoic acid synthase PhaR subunit
LAEERRRGAGMDPAELWRQWFEGMESIQKRMMGASVGDGAEGSEGADPQEMWRKWFDATADSWEKSAELGREMLEITPRWMEMLDQSRTNLVSAGSFPKDPLEFAVQWYNATSGPFSEFVHDAIEREEFLERASHWMQNYASFYRVFRRRSEEYLKALQVPVRSDIARVAGLVVALEDKVDRIEEAFEEFEYGYAKPATAEELGELEKRLDRVEGKLDRLLAVLENGSPNGSPERAVSEAGIKVTEAARREALELGVDLTEVEGTGNGGQITVGDVRRKGAS